MFQNDNAIKELDLLLPEFTSHLNQIRSFFAQIDNVILFFEAQNLNHRREICIEYRTQLEVSALLTIATLDLMVSCKNLLRSTEIWEEIYYLRHGYLTIYETLQRLDSFGHWIKMNAEKYPLQMEQYYELQSSLRSYKKKYDYHKFLPQLRNTVTAHIHKDFIDYFNKISAFDIEKAIAALLDFIQIINIFQNFVNSICKESQRQLEKEATNMDFLFRQKLSEIHLHFGTLQTKLKSELFSD